MTAIFEPPAVNTARKVAQLFQERPASHSQTLGFDDFVPYERERDHLGRLISAKITNTATTSNTRTRSLNIVPRPTPPSDSTIERLFRQTHIPAPERPAGMKKGKIRSSSSKQLPTPAVGQYDAVGIADKMKYRKAREVVFSSIKRPTTAQRISTESSSKRQIVHYHQVSTEPSKAKQVSKTPLNFNLPELEKYLEMKKLKVPLNENFEQSHLKFKELASKGLGLVKTIRNNIEFE